MRIKPFHVRILLIMLVLAGLIFAFRAFITAAIIQPLALLLWALWRLLASVDTHLYWALAVVLLAVPALRLALPSTPDRRRSAYAQQEPDPGRVARWKRMLEAWPDEEPRSALEANLAAMLRSVLLGAGRPGRSGAGHAASLPGSLPIQAQRLLRAGTDPDSTESPPRTRVSRALLPRMGRVVHRLFKPDDSWIEETLDWMEVELDIHEDNDARKPE